MKVDAVLYFIANHTEQIIGTMFAGILLTAVVLLFRSIGKGEDSGAGTGVALDAQQLEGTLRKVLAAAPVTSAAAPAADANPVSSAAVAAEIQQLNTAVAEREQKITVLQQSLDSAKADLAKGVAGKVDNGELNALKAKIADLEGRLAEYEIIEDDIADLSMYKEENAKLKAQLETLKAGGELPPEVEVAVAPKVAEAPPEEPVAVEPEPVVEAPKEMFEEPAQAVDESDMGSADDVMKEFAAAVENQKSNKNAKTNQISAAELEAELDAATSAKFGDRKSAAPEASPEPEATPPPPPKVVEHILREGEIRVAKDDIVDDPKALATYLADAPSSDADAAVADEAVNSEATDFDDPLAGELDTTKMLTEVETLESSTEEADGDPLADLLDTDKLMAEMSSMDGDDSSPKGDDDLLGEFREMKKGS